MNLGELYVTLRASFDEFNRNNEEAKKKLKGVSDEMGGVVKSSTLMRAAVLGAAVAIGVALIGLTKKALEAGDQMGKAAIRAGTTAGAFSELAYAAGTVGVDVNGMSDAMREMNQTVNQAEQGLEKPARAMRALGLEAKELKGLRPEKTFEIIVQRISELPSAADKSRAALELFGAAGAQLLPLFEKGAKGIKAAREEAVRLGAAMSDDQVKKLSDAHDSIDRLKASWDGFAVTLGSKVAPALTRVFDILTRSGPQESEESLQYKLQGLEHGESPEAKAQAAAIRKQLKAMQDLRHGVTGKRTGRREADGGGEAIGFVAAQGDEDRIKAAEEEAKELKAIQKDINDWMVGNYADLNATVKAGADQTTQDLEEQGQARMDIADAQYLHERDLEEQRKNLQTARLEELYKAVATEGELENARYAAALDMLETYSDAEIDAVGGYQEIREQMEKDHQARLKDIVQSGAADMAAFQAMSWNNQVETVAGSISRMTAGVASGNKKMFELHKAASLAQAVVSLPAAIIDSYKNAGGYPWGIAAAAAMAAAGAAQIAQIKNAHYGGGATAAPSAGGGAAPGATGAEGGGRVISVEGLDTNSLFTGKSVRGLLDAINEALADGGKLVIT
jgi:hypothetical protein